MIDLKKFILWEFSFWKIRFGEPEGSLSIRPKVVSVCFQSWLRKIRYHRLGYFHSLYRKIRWHRSASLLFESYASTKKKSLIFKVPFLCHNYIAVLNNLQNIVYASVLFVHLGQDRDKFDKKLLMCEINV